MAPLLDAAARRSKREAAWVTLLIHSGFRARELLGCRVADVADGIAVRDFLKIQRRRMKGGARYQSVTARSVPLSAAAQAALTAYLQERADEGTLLPDAPLVRSRSGRPLSIWRANAIHKELIRDAGFAGAGCFSLHSARKAYAHRLLKVSGDLLVVRDGLGHAHVATTEIYLGRRHRHAYALTRNLWTEDEPSSAPARDSAPLGELRSA